MTELAQRLSDLDEAVAKASPKFAKRLKPPAMAGEMGRLEAAVPDLRDEARA